MGKMQPVDFTSVEDFLEFLPANERKIVDVLRSLVLQTIPECTEKLSYNVPYYSRKKRICYIWPSSVPWGNVKLNGVQLGFCYGNLIDDEIGFLEKGKRKQVYVKTFMKPAEIDHEMVKAYLDLAVEVDK